MNREARSAETSPPAETIRPRGRRPKRILLAAGLVALTALSLLALRLWPVSFRYYTDADTIKLPVAEADIRQILWQPPQPLSDIINTLADDYEPRPSFDGSMLFFVRGKAGANADIHFSTRVCGGWTQPQPLTGVNSEYDDLGPEPSPDGQALYFYSDRPGGCGGYDIWVAHRGRDGWQDPLNLGPLVNSEFNDYGPGLTPDGAALYFASNRPRPDDTVQPDPGAWPATLREDLYHRDYDLYASPMIARGAGQAQAVTALNTPYDEGSPAVSAFGDFLYFASDRPGGLGGFDLYRSRRLRGGHQPAENLGSTVNTAGNELDPGLGLGGYALYFSSDRRPEEVGPPRPGKYDLYYTTSREVFAETQRVERPPIDWAALWWRIAPNLLWALLALLFLLAFLALFRGARGRRLSLLAKCLLASLAAHLLLMLLFNTWEVTAALAGEFRRRGALKVSLAAPVAGESLAGQITGRLTDVQSPAASAVVAVRERAAPMTVPPSPATTAKLTVERSLADLRTEPSVQLAARDAAIEHHTALPASETTTSAADRPRPFEPHLPQEGVPDARSEPQPALPGETARPQPPARPAVALPETSPRYSTTPVSPTFTNGLPPENRPRLAGEAPTLDARPPIPGPAGFSANAVSAGPLDADSLVLPPAPSQEPASRAEPAAHITPSLSEDVRGELSFAAPPQTVKPALQRIEPETSAPVQDRVGLADTPVPPPRDAVVVPRGGAGIRAVSPDAGTPPRTDVQLASLETTGATSVSEPHRGLPYGAARLPRATPPVHDAPARAHEATASIDPGGIELPAADLPATDLTTNTVDAPVDHSQPDLAKAGTRFDSVPVDLPGLSLSLPADSTLVSGPESPACSVPGALLLPRAAPSPRPAHSEGPPAIALSVSPTPVLELARAAPVFNDARAAARDADRPPQSPGRQPPCPPAPALPQTPALALSLPAEEIAPDTPYAQRRVSDRLSVVERLGGSEDTERAVGNALQWLARHQSAEGHWSGRGFDDRCGRCGGETEIAVDHALTGLALLCFLGAGHTHVTDGPYRDNVERGLRWLRTRQRDDGDLRGDETMYTQGIATIALSEAYGMTRDPALADSVRLAAQFIDRARNQRAGGWRYDPGQAGDTSVLGWQVMALKSAAINGIAVPAASFEAARKWLDLVSDPSQPGLYGYQPRRQYTPAMTAEGMFTQQLLGRRPEDPRMRASAEHLLQFLPEWDPRPNTYYWYYATLALFQHQGPAWPAWNKALTGQLLGHQRQDGAAAGSWNPEGEWADVGGRVYQTALCTLMLEVYYRYLPLYSLDAVTDPIGTIRGVVTDAKTAALLPGAEVRLDLADRPPILATTAADGAYTLSPPQMPDFFALSASKEGYVPSTANVASATVEGTTLTLNFQLHPDTEELIAMEPVPDVHHLGDDNFDGLINSQFQKKSEGSSFAATFELGSHQVPPHVRAAEVRLLAKGVQRRHRIRINDATLEQRLANAPDDGSFGEFSAQFDPSLLVPGTNTFEIIAAPSSSDIDDFEFVNVQIHLLP